MPFASLQASLLTSDHTKTSLMSARTANILFAGVGTFVFLGVVASSVVTCLASQAVWEQASKILDALRAQETGWTPTTNSLPALLAIAPKLQTLQDRIAYNRTCVFFLLSLTFERNLIDFFPSFLVKTAFNSQRSASGSPSRSSSSVSASAVSDSPASCTTKSNSTSTNSSDLSVQKRACSPVARTARRDKSTRRRRRRARKRRRERPNLGIRCSRRRMRGGVRRGRR
jgi:hypothetical protein